MRRLWRLKDAKMRALACVNDLGHKLVAVPHNAKQASRAGAFGNALVFGVGTPADLAQVGKGIVCLVAVYVVNFLRRPFASDVQPCELMRHRPVAIEHGVDVAIAAQRSGRHPGLFSSLGLQVSELAGLLAVMRKLAQALLSDHVAPHQSGKPSKDAASGDESPVPRRVSCLDILPAVVANPIDCGKIKVLSRPGHQQLVPSWRVAYA